MQQALMQRHIYKDVSISSTIENIESDYRMNLHLSLKVMIKSAFKDDLEKTKELLTMITQALPYEIIKPISNYEVAIEQSKEFRAENSKLKVESFQKDVKISQLEEVNSQLENENSQQGNKISQLESENKKKEEIIKKLRDELNSKK